MNATIKHILIEVKSIKIGYTVRIDGLFGTVVGIDGDKATVNFTDGSSYNAYNVEELKYVVVKFLAVMRDLNSFPVIHSDFVSLISFFDTKEKVAEYVNGKNVVAEGTLMNILSHPNEGDVVELSSLKIAEKYDLLGSRTSRIGIISKRVPGNNSGNNSFVVEFPNRTIKLKRVEFNLLNGMNSKQLFKITE